MKAKGLTACAIIYVVSIMSFLLQIAYGRGMITLEQRNQVYQVMHSLKLPFWHPVCNPDLFYKVCTYPASIFVLPAL